ncbi:hypothetical protein [Tissierella praeacuta]|uniref:hypothetical protein n=1 Tax=Tissierella praeacuta TaxID=43131 RepID=UPI001C120D23|nr:hypothetical protein [Tissierella praeacuta]MBU5256975.1 hypothetical protein [Tissierella praeacuta]
MIRLKCCYKNRVIILIIISMINIVILPSCERNEVNKSTFSEKIEAINSLSLVDVEKYMTDNVESTLKEFDELSLKKIVLYEDKLLLKKDSYEKSLNNMSVKIYLDINEELDDVEKEKISDLFKQKLLETISNKNRIELTRMRLIDIVYSSADLNNSIEFIETDSDVKSLSLKQKDELNLFDRTIFEVFKSNISFLNEKSEYEINRLGLEEDTLKFETKVYYYNDEEYENKLKNISDVTFNEIVKNKDLLKILKNNNIKNIEFTYDGKWYKYGEPLIYNYNL